MQEYKQNFKARIFLNSASQCFLSTIRYAAVLGNVFMTAVTLRHKIGFPTEPIHNFSH